MALMRGRLVRAIGHGIRRLLSGGAQSGEGRSREVHLEIPLVSKHARYLHLVDESHYQERNTLKLPDRQGELWASRFDCMVWVGDERVGLAWCSVVTGWECSHSR